MFYTKALVYTRLVKRLYRYYIVSRPGELILLSLDDKIKPKKKKRHLNECWHIF